ncbi:MAG: lysylphosphatidylglycerol synthase transmembrane domain-containing protein [Verrucomicrobiota bacterium]
MTRKHTKHPPLLSFSVRFFIVCGLFLYLYYTLDWKKFAAIIFASDARWFVAAFAAYGVTTLLSMVRWQILLSACKAPIRFLRTAQLTMVGLFANAFLPGVMSGDIFKILYATRDMPKIKPTVVMSIIMERLLGFVAMFLVSTALILSRYRALTSETATRYAVYFYFISFGAILFLLALGAWKKSAKFFPFLKKLPWQDTLREAVHAYRFFLSHPTCFWGGITLSIVAHFSLMMMSYFVSNALGMNLDFWDLAAVLPLVMLVTLIPATPSGLGVREVAFQHFLLFAGMTQEASVALSLGGFSVVLAWNLIGGLVYLGMNRKSPA